MANVSGAVQIETGIKHGLSIPFQSVAGRTIDRRWDTTGRRYQLLPPKIERPRSLGPGVRRDDHVERPFMTSPKSLSRSPPSTVSGTTIVLSLIHISEPTRPY